VADPAEVDRHQYHRQVADGEGEQRDIALEPGQYQQRDADHAPRSDQAIDQ
jgi:hypothetical protein